MTLLERVREAVEVHADLHEALRLIVEHFGAESGTIHLLETDGLLHLRAATDNIPGEALDRVRLLPAGEGLAGAAFASREPVQAEAAIAVPVLEDGDAAGALGIASRPPRRFTAEETGLLLEAGRAIARGPLLR